MTCYETPTGSLIICNLCGKEWHNLKKDQMKKVWSEHECKKILEKANEDSKR